MKLIGVHAREFWSINDSNSFKIGDITCLVGKNEAGKTALLQALYRLNPIQTADSKFDVTDDYPRQTVADYEKDVASSKRWHAIVVEATFELEPKELSPIQDALGAKVLNAPTMTLSKGYSNEMFLDMPTNEKAAGMALLEKAGLAGETETHPDRWGALSELSHILDQRSEALQARFIAAQTAANVLADPDEKTKALAEAQLVQETVAAKNLRAELQVINKEGLANHIYSQHLASFVPRFLYFDEYYQMRGCENIQALQQRIESKHLNRSDHPLIGLIELAGLKLEELLNPARTRDLINKLEGAGNHLTRQILKYWTQNKYLQLKFDVRPARPGDPEGMREGSNIWGTVYDAKHYVTTDLGSRSKGFVWFFSFLAWYSRLKDNRKLILLLDEPGLSLHGKAQEDLLRYFEDQLKPNHQLIYTTHSPFMVDSCHFERVRIVQDRGIDANAELSVAEEGTKVITDVLEATEDSLFPLHGALGYEIYQTLFIGPNSLIVEGASDLLYVQALSGFLSRLDREGLSPKWTVTPVGGADKVPTFVALVGSQKGLNVATLIDFQKSHAQMVENLYKGKLLKKTHVLTFADFTGRRESDVEDMFEPDLYVRVVNAEFQKELERPIDLADLNLAPPRIVLTLAEYFSANPLKTGAFGHFRPARYLVENLATLGPLLSSATLDRFERAFKALNALL